MPRRDRITKADFGEKPKNGKCKCGHIVCVCHVKKAHKPGCKFRAAMACPVGIECEHGYDVCPKCDPCTCNNATSKTQKSKARQSRRSHHRAVKGSVPIHGRRTQVHRQPDRERNVRQAGRIRDRRGDPRSGGVRAQAIRQSQAGAKPKTRTLGRFLGYGVFSGYNFDYKTRVFCEVVGICETREHADICGNNVGLGLLHRDTRRIFTKTKLNVGNQEYPRFVTAAWWLRRNKRKAPRA